jgi:hypothetical protein
MRRLGFVVFAIVVSIASQVAAQDAVPGEILSRTFYIKNGNESGTAFAVDYEGDMFLITARHLAAGLPTENATIQIWQQGQWKDYHTLKTLYPSSNDADIAVLETSEKVKTPYGITPVAPDDGATFGQPVWFLGYPFGIYSHVTNQETVFPFIKRGTMSAIDASNPDAVIVYIDGFNDPGFSGGPIVYWDFKKHAYRIVAVVSGYRTDTAKTVVNGRQIDTPLLVNSGILISYHIDHAMKAIKDSKAQTQPAK